MRLKIIAFDIAREMKPQTLSKIHNLNIYYHGKEYNYPTRERHHTYTLGIYTSEDTVKIKTAYSDSNIIYADTSDYEEWFEYDCTDTPFLPIVHVS